MSPEDMLGEAERLRVTPMSGTAGWWPRACAWLIRCSLEAGLRRFWLGTEPSVADCRMRAQLLLLPRYAGEETARRACQAWGGLSRAGHHHPYELAPTVGELRGWHDLVGTVLVDLAVCVPEPQTQRPLW